MNPIAISPTFRRLVALAALTAMAFASAGCGGGGGGPTEPPPPPVEPPPDPSSPAGLVRLLEWCWDHEDATKYRELFTEDYRFVFASFDPAGTAFGGILTRDEELAAATNLFPPARQIVVDLDANLVVQNDSRPGKNPTWHKEITTGTAVAIVIDPLSKHVRGTHRFFVVRGDSAQIPSGLGLMPDPNRWYIERWEDVSADDCPAPGPGGDARRAVPARVQTPEWCGTIGRVKAEYQ